MTPFWDVTPYSLVCMWRHFSGTCCLNYQIILFLSVHKKTRRRNVIVIFKLAAMRTSNLIIIISCVITVLKIYNLEYNRAELFTLSLSISRKSFMDNFNTHTYNNFPLDISLWNFLLHLSSKCSNMNALPLEVAITVNTWWGAQMRPATTTQVFLDFPVSISKCWDGSQDSKLPLHASHVVLPT